jgi:hypothetical protein
MKALGIAPQHTGGKIEIRGAGGDDDRAEQGHAEPSTQPEWPRDLQQRDTSQAMSKR